MTYTVPTFDPSSSYSIEVTSADVYSQLRQLDSTLIGTTDYLGFAYWWSGGDQYKHTLREASAWAKKRIHDVLVHNNIPLEDTHRTPDDQEKALEIYRNYL
jgi:hypothetical protein|tara:strand:- start:739 stop:1041 length:303 start_codon:yes stop_codon:yes gene_type:complete